MATTYPGSIQYFPTMENITAADAALVSQFQNAMRNGDLSAANAILKQIPNYDKKILMSEFFNTIHDTTVALQKEFDTKYNPTITVSVNPPANPRPMDYWFKVYSY